MISIESLDYSARTKNVAENTNRKRKGRRPVACTNEIRPLLVAVQLRSRLL